MLKKAIIILMLCFIIAPAVSAWSNTYPYVDANLNINGSLFSSDEYTNDPNVTLSIWTSDCQVPYGDNIGVNDFWEGRYLDLFLWDGEPIDIEDADIDLPNLKGLIRIGHPFFDTMNANEGWTSTQIAPPAGLTLTTGPYILSGEDGPKTISGLVHIIASFSEMDRGAPDFITWISESFTRTIILDTASPEGIALIEHDVIKNGVPYTRSQVITLNLSANDNIIDTNQIKMRIWEAGGGNTGWRDFSTNPTFQLSAGDGVKTAHVAFKDLAGNVSDTYSNEITLDTQSPIGGSITINNGASATTSNIVGLNIILPSDNISGSDQIEMWIENTDIPTNSTGWMPLATTYPDWPLPFSDDIRQVRIKFRDAAENETEWIYSQEIILDTTPPENCSISVQGATEYDGTNYITFPDVVLNLEATDNYHPIKMFITHTEQELSNNDGLAVAVGIGDREIGYIPFGGGDDGWLDYTPTHEWQEILNSGFLHTFKVKFKDSLGNHEVDANGDDVWYEYSVIYDQTPPTGVVSVIGRSGHEDSVREYEGTRYVQRESLRLDTSNVSDDTAWIKISGDISSVMGMDTPDYIDNWIEYTPNDYVDIALNSNVFPGDPSMEEIINIMTKQVNVQFKDKAENVSDLITQEIILDAHDPAIPTITTPSGTVQDISQIAGEASDKIEDNLWNEHPGGSGIASVKVRINHYWNGDYYYYYESDWLQSGWSNWDGDVEGDGVIDYIIWHEATINDLGDGTATWELPFTLPQNPPWDDTVPYTITISTRAYDKAGNESSKENITITINQSAPPSTPEVTIRKEGNDVVLSWDDIADSYKVYRKANEPYFTENPAYLVDPANLVVNGNTVTYTHNNAVGDPNTNYYYFVVAVSASERESDPSNRVGEFDFELIHNDGIPSVNAVTLVLDPAQMQMDAEGLANVIPNCSSVAEWVAGTQSYNEHPIGVPFNNFEAKVGYPYFVTVTADGVWTQVGGVPEEGSPEFALIHNNGIPSVNAISVKLNRDDIVDAEGLANDIPNCSSAAEWVAETQSYNEHPIGVPFNNFSVKPGYPYFVTVTENGTW